MSFDSPAVLSILAVPAFEDNYLWLIHDHRHAVVVDPGDARVIEDALSALQLELVAIVLTHHHRDHTGGVLDLARSRPGLPVYGPGSESIAGITVALVESDVVSLPHLNVRFSVIAVPGHTLGHIAYFAPTGFEHPVLFCGDTLFAGGCGRLFEGTAAQMQGSLAKLRALPDDTAVYCAHEYTLSNLRFAQAVDPANAHLLERFKQAQASRAAHKPTVPSTIGMEKATNPFMRWDAPAIRARAAQLSPGSENATGNHAGGDSNLQGSVLELAYSCRDGMT